MRMFRKNILWIAIGNRNGLLLISKKIFSCCSSVKKSFKSFFKRIN
ncbi:hypothetical protein LTSEWAN_5860 [Salmonella enterica subsp. enterica serovar Wandsworth str. A4-580]|uniref:Uncharacterized protein n=1 Tax=Salmonella enterica subsp. enterica serovar Wandsworth str. A4-580 TaxID=913086 RepID=G5SJD6_SALET|nr:hypothetical protein LTSEWAN_5860 [Salmonella enterica subsp. enterica serovar Wandsworth str. A4-580]